MVDDKQFQFPSDEPDQKFYWRIDMSPPVLRAGWQTDQSANSKDLTFNFNPAKFQSNPRLGPSPPAVANIFNLPLGTKYQNAATAALPACSTHFSCYAGNNPGQAPLAPGAAQAAAATSQLPCYPTQSGECDVFA